MAAKPTAKPAGEPPKPVSHTTGQAFETSLEGLRGHLESVERVDDGRLRWTIVLVNESGHALEIGFDARETYLSDDLGHRYGVLRTDHPESEFREALPAGARTVHWFEFATPAKGARRFYVVLASHSPQTLRYAPFEVTLPDPK